MSTWEERMSLRAQERKRTRQVERDLNDPHREHHTHIYGTGVYCSCGEFNGITCVVFPANFDEWFASDPPCKTCGLPMSQWPRNDQFQEWFIYDDLRQRPGN